MYIYCLSLYLITFSIFNTGNKNGTPGSKRLNLDDKTCDCMTGFSDLHNSVLQRLYWNKNINTLFDSSNQVNISDLEEVRAKILFMSLGFSEIDLRHPDTVTVEGILKFYRNFRESCNSLYPNFDYVNNKKGAYDATEKGHTAILLALEGTSLLKGDISSVDSLYAAGVRMITIAHYFQNEFIRDYTGGRSGEIATKPSKFNRMLNGQSILTDKGKELVEKMIGLKMLIDVSHLPQTAFWEVVRINNGRSPLIASHSNVKTLCDTARNLSDSQIMAIAKTGGLVGICFHSPFLKESGKAKASEIVDHIEYILRLTGPEHVTLGTDFEGGIQPPDSVKSIKDCQLIFREMEKRGYSNDIIHEVIYENIFRIIPE